MDIFNYLTVMISILLGLGLTQLFAGIGNLLQVRQHLKPYWLHSLWVLLLMVLHVHTWWSFWALRAAVAWTYGLFLYLVLGPAGLVIASHLILPGGFSVEGAAGRVDLKQHYYDTSPLFFGLLTGIMAWALVLEPMLGVHPLLSSFRVLQALGLVILGSCAVSRNRVLHTVAVVGIVGLLASVIFLIRARAGAFDFR